ncbi:hypothetical protein [Feifania hominis]|nr:hypothetical protein [Feifania hominis]
MQIPPELIWTTGYLELNHIKTNSRAVIESPAGAAASAGAGGRKL